MGISIDGIFDEGLLHQIYNESMEQQAGQDQQNWITYRKPMRADFISNQQMLFILIKLLICFSSLCGLSKMLPEAKELQSYTPLIWNQTDEFDVRKISPLNRKIKFFILAQNPQQKIDDVSQAQTFSLKDMQQHQMRYNVKLNNLKDFQTFDGIQQKYSIGDLHVLDQVAFRVKILKPEKNISRVLQSENNETLQAKQEQTQVKQENTSQIINKQANVSQAINESTNISQISNKTTNNGSEIEQANTNQQKNKTTIDQKDEGSDKANISNQTMDKNETKQIDEGDNLTSSNETAQQLEERLKREQQEEEKRIKQQKQQKEKQEREKKKEEEEKRIRQIMQKTNIRIEAHYMAKFATIMELVVKYISILVIIYMGTDNPSAPIGIPIICAIFSNPLLFIQVSFPNDVGNVIDSFCLSAPLLYPSLWMYYIHHKIKYDDEKDGPIFLIAKMVPCLLIYFLQVLRLMHFDVLVWQTVIGVCVWAIMSWYLWQAFLNIKYQHHRDKLIFSVSLSFFGYLIVFNQLAHSWNFLINYIIIQSYGLFLIYLMGSKKQSKAKKGQKQKNKKQVKSAENLAQYEANLEDEEMNMQEIKSDEND